VEEASIKFEENSYTLNDVAYDGTVEVVGPAIAVGDSDYSLFAPGAMETYKDGESQILLPYGRVNVELYSDTRDKLDISKAAEIKFEIEDDLAQIAPDEIPMWYLDTGTGRWIEDGLAIKSGFQYIGEVSHFTDWSICEPFDVYTVSGKVTRNGMP